jgi:hypothetical protein
MAGPKGSQKLAVLLCKFKDTSTVEPQPRSFFEDLFVNVGTGGLNDYWRAASHNAINTDGTKVFGWQTIDKNQADYIKDNPSRWEKIKGVFGSFSDFKPEDFAGVITVFNSDVQDGGHHNGVLVNFDSYNVTFIAHETGHHFGLEHSFDESDRKNADWSAPGEYFDPYDIMSAMAVSAAPSARFSIAGPLACAPHLDRMGWLDRSRVWTPANKGSGSDILELVSLGHPEVPGYLAAQIGNHYVEFRTQDGFDAGIPQPTVLIHYLNDPNPIVLASDKTNWNYQWLPGMTFGPNEVELKIKGGLQIEILSFDLNAKKARIRVRIVAPMRIPVEGPVKIYGGVASDGGGFVILPSGKIIKIPPRSPILDLVSKLALIPEAEMVLSKEVFVDARKMILEDVSRSLVMVKDKYR